MAPTRPGLVIPGRRRPDRRRRRVPDADRLGRGPPRLREGQRAGHDRGDRPRATSLVSRPDPPRPARCLDRRHPDHPRTRPLPRRGPGRGVREGLAPGDDRRRPNPRRRPPAGGSRAPDPRDGRRVVQRSRRPRGAGQHEPNHPPDRRGPRLADPRPRPGGRQVATTRSEVAGSRITSRPACSKFHVGGTVANPNVAAPDRGRRRRRGRRHRLLRQATQASTGIWSNDGQPAIYDRRRVPVRLGLAPVRH